MNIINKPVVIEQDGTYGMLPNGGIINAGGTASSTFTVNGKGLLFDDGTSTSGTTNSSATLQTVYNNSQNNNGSAGIILSPGKDFAIKDPYSDGNYFTVSSLDGTVHVNGNLIVTGSTTTVNTIVTEGNSIKLSPSTGTVSPLLIEPDLGISPIVDLVTIRRIYGGAPVFRIAANGNIISTTNLTIGGNINGINITSLNMSVNNHASGVVGYQHPATDVTITPIQNIPNTTNVQGALDYLSSHMTGGNNSTGNVYGFGYTQATPATQWTISHMGHTFRLQVTIYDNAYEQITPHKVHIIDLNTAQVLFTSPQSGSAVIIMF